jgi:hypothetical protein
MQVIEHCNMRSIHLLHLLESSIILLPESARTSLTSSLAVSYDGAGGARGIGRQRCLARRLSDYLTTDELFLAVVVVLVTWQVLTS